MELEDRVSLITGGKRIGAVVATELARAGSDVALVYRTSRTEAEQTGQAVEALGRRAFVIQADLARVDECERVVTESVETLGRLDVLINMASVYKRRPVDDVTLQDWDTQMAVDLRS